MEKSLDTLCLGQKGIVTGINTHQTLCKRMAEFGLVPGTQVCCRYRTPGGSVTALEFRGTVLALRTRDMKHIQVRC